MPRSYPPEFSRTVLTLAACTKIAEIAADREVVADVYN